MQDLSQTQLLPRSRPIDRLGRGSLAWVLRPLYRLYENRLIGQIGCNPIPRHIGIILDGNRRHGERYGMHDPRAIYALGAQKLDDVLCPNDAPCPALRQPANAVQIFRISAR